MAPQIGVEVGELSMIADNYHLMSSVLTGSPSQKKFDIKASADI